MAEDHQLINKWRKCLCQKPPFLFPGDEDVINENGKNTTCYQSFKDFIESRDFGSRDDHKLHLGLIPTPYMGNLEKGSIFILMLNPGLSPLTYYAEHDNDEYSAALKSNLHQENLDENYPFMFLNPNFSWVSGYWMGKLYRTIEKLSNDLKIEFKMALSRFAQETCVLQLLPYHAKTFGLPETALKKLSSVKLIKKYVHDIIVPKVKNNQALIIVARKVKFWELSNHHNIIKYDGPESRGVPLGPSSRGGKAILNHLRKSFGLREAP
jgi:hypothetical protein